MFFNGPEAEGNQIKGGGGAVNGAIDYSVGEIKYLPEHFDVNSRNLIQFMLMEAFNAGYIKGFDSGTIHALKNTRLYADEMIDGIKRRQEPNLDPNLK